MSKHTAKVNDGTAGEPINKTHGENIAAAEDNVKRERRLAVAGATERYEISGRQYRRKGRPLNQMIEPLPEHGSVFGKFMGIQVLRDRQNNPMVGKFGTPLEFFELVQDNGEVCQYWSNGGFKGAVALARLNSGDLVEIESTGETTPHPEWGTPLPTYNIYPIEAASPEGNQPAKPEGEKADGAA